MVASKSVARSLLADGVEMTEVATPTLGGKANHLALNGWSWGIRAAKDSGCKLRLDLHEGTGISTAERAGAAAILSASRNRSAGALLKIT
jgi:hypothetical protein